MYMSCKPSRFGLCSILISTMTSLAKIAKLAELPTDVVGTICPSSVMATASITATSGMVNWWLRKCSTVSDKCWSINITSPLLIALRKVLSTWKGIRRAKMPASVNSLSRSLPNDAPVIKFILIGFFLTCSINALGTALASPARVKPLIPTVIPSLINWLACSAGITLSCRLLLRIRSKCILSSSLNLTLF